MSKHAQREWEINDLEDGSAEIVIWDYDANGEIDGSTVIVPSLWYDDEEAKKRAALIVAAPDLLAALKQVNDCLVKCLTGGEVSAKLAGKAIENAALLIERIEGESK